MSSLKILPARSGGKGTMRSMVEGQRVSAGFDIAPSTVAARRSPSPQVGRISA